MSDKATVLFVDDENRILRSMSALFRLDYNVISSVDPLEALDLIQDQPIDVIVSDYKMPGMNGVELLTKVKELSPNTVRLLLTGQADLNAVMHAINEGQIFRLVEKPWDNQAFKQTVTKAVEQAQLNRNMPDEAPPEDCGVLVVDRAGDLFQRVRDLNLKAKLYRGYDLDEITDILESECIQVMLCHQGTDPESVRSMLNMLTERYPLVTTLVSSSIQDMSWTIELINETNIYRFIHPPYSDLTLKQNLVQAMKHHHQRKLLDS